VIGEMGFDGLVRVVESRGVSGGDRLAASLDGILPFDVVEFFRLRHVYL